MNQYFVLENGKVSEPLGLDELQGKVASGEITEEHLISINGDWVVARDICDLFPEIECEVVERKSELSKETTAINDSKTIQNDRNHIRKINYSPIKGHWHSYSFQIMIISSFILSRRGILLSKGEPFTVAIAIIAIISSLTFIILYLYILYQLWNKVNNLDNTRWPNPSLVTGINIGIIILYMLEFPDLILTISIMGMMLAHLLLGQRIKKVLARSGEPQRSWWPTPIMQYTYASILCAICAAVFRSAITNHDIREYYSHSILFVLAILLYFPYRFLKIAIANINQCLQKEIVPSEEEKENKAVGLVKSKTLRIQQDTAIKFHTMVIAVIIIVILFISMAAMNNFSSVNTTSSLDVNFRTSKLTSMGQPVFKNMGNTSIENLHVKIVRKNRSFGPESIIPSLKSGEEIILPRGDGWVVERGDSVIVEHEGNNKRLTFQ